ncbi:MAG: D-cysteine desulfhydrase family protein [Anaerolineae bacterium]|nr:D-cysteine desulfhydrase family protein [Anaerolineae bacterium]MDH7473828.1 D-cysteine desulfhydrase family protein [Anaerolineae bacterium]
MEESTFDTRTMLSHLPRVEIAHLPTPLEEMHRLSKTLGGPRLLIKRDDQTGLATGGNKARKLEFLVADALAQRATTLITTGAPQSNHCRQTAAAAARFGLRAVLVLSGEPPADQTGNLLLDTLLGAEVRWAGGREREAVMAEVVEEEREAGRVPYVVPYGGSNAVGATGYVLAMAELMAQLARRNLQVQRIVFASSSGGTQAGLVVGAKAFGFMGRIEGISVDKSRPVLQEWVHRLAAKTAAYIGLRSTFTPTEFTIHDEYLGGGYGVMGDAEREAIRLVAQTEGILLDPVYTGRAMAGLIDLVRRGVYRPDETIVFWHTGGIPALFAYRHELV